MRNISDVTSISEDMFLIYLLKNKPNSAIAAHGTLLQAEQRHWHLPGVLWGWGWGWGGNGGIGGTAISQDNQCLQVSALNCNDRATGEVVA